MRSLFTLTIFVFLFSFSYAQDITKEVLKNSINLDQLEHPYLLFDKEDVKEIKKRIQNDEESRMIMTRMLTEAKALLYMPVDPNVPERGNHIRAGWTSVDRGKEYEKKMRNYAHFAQTLAFVYQVTGEKKYAQKAFDFADMLCNMPVWLLQAHEFPIIYSRVMPWNVDDHQVNFNFDIRTAGLGEDIACVYDWTYEALNKEQRDRLQGILLEKVITPVRGDYEFHWWATSYRCNWTGVCNGGLGVTAIALLKEYPMLVDVVMESHNRINRMMNEIGEDGGWQEGVSYWRYGLHHATRFAVSLNNISGGKHNLFKNERLVANPAAFPIYMFIPPNRAVDFGDSSAKRTGATDLFNLLATQTNDSSAAWYRNEVLNQGRGIYDLIFKRPESKGVPPAAPSKHFKTIDWWVMRSDFTDENKVYLAGKAGKNDDPHHGHLDIGHFVLYWKGQAFIKDLGKAYYDEEYFDETRWEYPQAASAGHNVLMVNAEQQLSGKLKDQPFNYDIGGEVVEFRTSKTLDYVLMDPTNAYPKKELKKWHRHIVLEKPNITLVLDEVETQKEKAKVDIRFHSEANESIQKEGYALLKGKAAQMAIIPVSNITIDFYQGKHAYQPVHAELPFEWLPYFGLHTMSEKKQSTIATLIVPIENEQEAQSIKSSLKMTEKADELVVNFEYRGKSYAQSFKKEANNLRLK